MKSVFDHALDYISVKLKYSVLFLAIFDLLVAMIVFAFMDAVTGKTTPQNMLSSRLAF